MAHRRIGQGVFRFGPRAERQTSLDELGAFIDWSNADRVLALLYPAAKGEKAWPPLAMFKALLLATWYDLSDVALSEALSDRASFRRFCDFSRDEATPERTAFVRFRRELVAHGLDRTLFEAIALEPKGTAVRKGTLIDAAVIGSASKGEKEAAWVRHRTRAPAHGYKAHIAADKNTAIIRKVETTPANEPDVSIAPAIIPDEPGDVYADRAYDALSVDKAIEGAGGTSKLIRKGHRHLPAERLEAHNRPLRPIRARIEKIFGTLKRAHRFDACVGSAFPKPNSRSISRSSLTTSNAIGACKPPERTCHADLPRGPATRTCHADLQNRPPASPSDDVISPLKRQFSKRNNPRLSSQSYPTLQATSPNTIPSPHTGLVSRETFWYDFAG